MENFYLNEVVAEMAPIIIGRSVGRVSAAGGDLQFDLRLRGGKLLIVSLDPSFPSLYLGRGERKIAIESGPYGPEKTTGQPLNQFALQLRKKLAGAVLSGVSKHPLDRVVLFEFDVSDEIGGRLRYRLVLALTGRSSTAYLTTDDGTIEAVIPYRRSAVIGAKFGSHREVAFDPQLALKTVSGELSREEALQAFFAPGSGMGPLLRDEFIRRCSRGAVEQALRSLLSDLYGKTHVPTIYSRIPVERIGQEPVQIKTGLLLSHIKLSLAEGMQRYEFGSFSEAAEAYAGLALRARSLFDAYSRVKRRLETEIRRTETTLVAIDADLSKYREPEKLKRLGDLLLANATAASAGGGSVKVCDYFDPEEPEIEIEIGSGETLQAAASRYYAQYQKARRALKSLEPRREALRGQIAKLRTLLESLSKDPSAQRVRQIDDMFSKTLGIGKAYGKPVTSSKRGKDKDKKACGRRFISSEGYDIVVGKTDRDNDEITFRLAGPQDVWLHAADYPGSHVIVRNPRREQVPHRTILEAAELAAYYSQAKKETKAAVHYTQKKYVSKPPRGRPGLVRLSSFKTVMVRPRRPVGPTSSGPDS